MIDVGSGFCQALQLYRLPWRRTTSYSGFTPDSRLTLAHLAVSAARDKHNDSPIRARIFVASWNFTLAMKDHESGFLVAVEKLGPVLALQTGKIDQFR